MKRAALVVTTLFALLAFGVGFVGTTVTLDVTRPVVSNSSATVQFVVNEGDNSTDIANKLEKAGLIRNALIFRLLAKVKHLDGNLKHGTYDLSPGMTMDEIITALEGAPLDEHIVVQVVPFSRITQYPDNFSKLPGFNADNFLKIAKTGKLLDSAQTPIWTKYWFVQQPGKQVKYALEGYLFADTYYFTKGDDETSVIEAMLNNLGEHLCPGPDNNFNSPNEYFHNKDQCIAHGAPMGSTNIFSAMEKAYSTKDPVAALHTVLTFASIIEHESNASADTAALTNVYYTRYMAVLGRTDNIGQVANLGSDPTVQYALESAKPPKDGKWWKELTDSGANLATTDPYNTYIVSGLPPGPISGATWDEIKASANPRISQYFYIYYSKCLKKWFYATTLAQHEANQAKPCS